MLDAQAIGTDSDGRCRVRVGDFELLGSRSHLGQGFRQGGVVRPERVRGGTQETGENRLPGKIERVVYAGAVSQLVVTLDRGPRSGACWPTTGWGHLSTVDRLFRCTCREALRVLRTDTTEAQASNDGAFPAAVSAQATTKS